MGTINLNVSYIGRKLVEMGKLTQEQLAEALTIQEKNRENGNFTKIGAILVKLGYCTDEDIAHAMSQISGIEFASFNNLTPSSEVMNLITPEIAQRYQAIPMRLENGKLYMAMHNPNDIIAIDDLVLVTGYEVHPVVVPDVELNAVIERFVNSSSRIGEEMEDEADSAPIETDYDDDKPAVQLANQILNNAIRAGASDVHIEAHEKYLRVRFRIDGVMHDIMRQPLKLHATLVSRIKVMGGMDIAERRIPQDGRATIKMEGKVFDIRIASLPSAYGEKLTLRLLSRSGRIITIDELGFPPLHKNRYLDAMRLPYGFILVTGPTGSGKSTTLYATLAERNSPDKNIITLEDPIERRMDGINQIQMNSRAGMTFASGLRSILRSDPDIIMIGEIRDKETAKIAVESALTGHMVFSTLHTNDAPGAVTRLGEMGVEPFLTASSLVGVVAQRLLRVLCPRCKKPYTLSREEILKSIPDFPLEEGEEEITLYKSKGCLACNGTGYKGRMGIYEFLSVGEDMQKLILSRASTNDIRELAIKEGMETLRGDGLIKVKNSVTSIEELLRVVV